MDFSDYEVQRRILLEYMQVMIARGDWHGVADAAMDLREMEAERKNFTASQESLWQNI